jgi:hypothetical protein
LQSEREAQHFLNFKASVEEGDKTLDSKQHKSPYYSIHEDIDLLEKIQDIRDELNILKSLLEDQRDVWHQAFTKPLSTKSGILGGGYLQCRRPTEVLEEIAEMDKEAERVQKAVSNVSDFSHP